MQISHVSKNGTPIGSDVAIALANPKYARNVAAAIRTSSAFGVPQVWMSGTRVSQEVEAAKRLPREERMKGYGAVDLYECDYFFDAFPADVTPVAIEVMPDGEQLPFFEHPEKALYVFGPEDGSIPSVFMRHCHRFVTIPTAHCLNLATAVSVVLYDRAAKRQALGLDPVLATADYLNENRGFDNVEPLFDRFGSEEIG